MITAGTSFRALGTTAQVVVTDGRHLSAAARLLRERLAELDAACSRFRPDSEISRLHEHAGAAVEVGPLLYAALEVALTAAERTGGLVDPTVGTAVRDLGYDRDFAAVAAETAEPVRGAPAPGWWRVRLDPVARRVVLPRGIRLDLGATAKALAADRAAAELAAETGAGVFVNLGGDLAVAGDPPAGGWRVVVGDDHATADPARDPVVTVRAGGLATSGTTRRTWRRAGRTVHHIVDPRTGDVPDPLWRTVSVAAPSCVDANTAATAAVVLGAAAPAWLAARGLPARLVGVRGRVEAVAGWPADEVLAS
ncbi:MAG TPA: FAD:protein FMN transferase [Actinophytocola sp.]|jgi:thiamine biosynthesis lipoprotein|nr:FAD:protein FMN transferase [Actinophytocola sp.]